MSSRSRHSTAACVSDWLITPSGQPAGVHAGLKRRQRGGFVFGVEFPAARNTAASPCQRRGAHGRAPALLAGRLRRKLKGVQRRRARKAWNTCRMCSSAGAAHTITRAGAGARAERRVASTIRPSVPSLPTNKWRRSPLLFSPPWFSRHIASASHHGEPGHPVAEHAVAHHLDAASVVGDVRQCDEPREQSPLEKYSPAPGRTIAGFRSPPGLTAHGGNHWSKSLISRICSNDTTSRQPPRRRHERPVAPAEGTSASQLDARQLHQRHYTSPRLCGNTTALAAGTRDQSRSHIARLSASVLDARRVNHGGRRAARSVMVGESVEEGLKVLQGVGALAKSRIP